MDRHQKRNALKLLLRDFGYSWTGDRLIENAIRGFTSARVVPYKFDSIYSAIEHLIPIVRSDEFYSRYARVCNQ